MLLPEGVLQVALAPTMGLIDSIQHETLRLLPKPQGANEISPVGSWGYEKEHTVKLQRSKSETAMTGHEKSKKQKPP